MTSQWVSPGVSQEYDARQNFNTWLSSVDKSLFVSYVDFHPAKGSLGALFYNMCLYFPKPQIFGPVGSFLIEQTKHLQIPPLRRGTLSVPLPPLATPHRETLSNCRDMICDNARGRLIIQVIIAQSEVVVPLSLPHKKAHFLEKWSHHALGQHNESLSFTGHMLKLRSAESPVYNLFSAEL